MSGSALVAAAIVAALWQWAAHWFPWDLWIRGESLGRLASYVVGVLGIVLGMGVWALVEATEQGLLALIVVVIASGAATVAAHGLDMLGQRKHFADTREEMDKVERE